MYEMPPTPGHWSFYVIILESLVFESDASKATSFLIDKWISFTLG